MENTGKRVGTPTLKSNFSLQESILFRLIITLVVQQRELL